VFLAVPGCRPTTASASRGSQPPQSDSKNAAKSSTEAIVVKEKTAGFFGSLWYHARVEGILWATKETPAMTDETPQTSDPGEAPAKGTPRPAADAGDGAARLIGPSGDGASVIPDEERELWKGRTSWKHYAGRLILLFLGNVVIAVLLYKGASRFDWLTGQAAFWACLLVVGISGLLVGLPVLWSVFGHRYRFTTQRLFIERGILSKTIDQTELIRIDDVQTYKSLLNRIFGLGSVVINSTDVSDRNVRLEGITDPDTVADDIRTQMRIMRRKSVFVERL
jgi:membrane protein YdbS with pleckstrin-like domain